MPQVVRNYSAFSAITGTIEEQLSACTSLPPAQPKPQVDRSRKAPKKPRGRGVILDLDDNVDVSHQGTESALSHQGIASALLPSLQSMLQQSMSQQQAKLQLQDPVLVTPLSVTEDPEASRLRQELSTLQASNRELEGQSATQVPLPKPTASAMNTRCLSHKAHVHSLECVPHRLRR